ncbi:unnamed protein product, partial [Symbiodinium necroappetens]
KALLRAAGVQAQALSEMSRMVADEAPEVQLSIAEDTAPSATVQNESPAEEFAKAMLRCLDNFSGKPGSSKQSLLDRALDGSAVGSLDGSLSSGRRSAAARRALREALETFPNRAFGAIRGRDGRRNDSFRARSQIQAFPTMVHLAWSTGGALDCLRAGKTEQAQLGHTHGRQCSIDRGSWLLAQELSLEVAPPMSSFRKHEVAGDPVYSRLHDARWAEAALAKLREEADYLDRRQKLTARLCGGSGNKDNAETPRLQPIPRSLRESLRESRRRQMHEPPGRAFWNSSLCALLKSGGPFLCSAAGEEPISHAIQLALPDALP